ncbi:MAG: putative metallophosphoesterase [Firmicutes bacterium]|nr:putative metallophosphoesterase [Bacillota bacterium]
MRSPSIVFLAMVLGTEVFISWLVYFFLNRLLEVFQKRWIRVAYWSITAVMTIATLASWTFYTTGIPVVGFTIGFAWILGLLFMLPLLLLVQGVVFCKKRWNKTEKTGQDKLDGDTMTRRDFLQHAATTVPALGLGVSVNGVFDAADIVVQRHNLVMPDFPAGIGKLKIAQISDTHIGPFFSIEKLDQVLSMLQREKPDMLVITGDLIDNLDELTATMERLEKFHATLPKGVYYCLGNHEYFRDLDRIRRVWKNSPATLLVNNSQQIIAGEKPVYLLGVDFPWVPRGASSDGKRQDYLQRALQNVPKGAFSLLASHHPDFITDAFQAGIPLTLTGHTHGGQVGLFGQSILPLKYQYMRGLYRQEQSYGYVSTGTGQWLPFRLGCPAEITMFTLAS